MTTVLSTRHLKINENDHNPPHVHVEGGGASVRINLNTLEVMDSETGFSKSTLKKIIAAVTDLQDYLLDEWRERHD